MFSLGILPTPIGAAGALLFLRGGRTREPGIALFGSTGFPSAMPRLQSRLEELEGAMIQVLSYASALAKSAGQTKLAATVHL